MYLVIEQSECDKCHGNGRVESYMWAEYWRMNPGGLDSSKKDIAWFWGIFGHYATEKSELPLEEETCGQCDGKGSILRKVDIQKPLQPLLERIEELQSQLNSMNEALENMYFRS